uniref:Uncharacterized protein n=1 Tax=Reclinomonas americana ATCC 50633 TaxID=1295593 RepID=M4QDY0_RECAM|nr:hypothetical protein [Reclinomonas americana ATCC 50633]
MFVHIIFCFFICFIFSYFFSYFLLNNAYDLSYPAQYYSSIDSSFIRLLFNSFDNNILIDNLDLEKNEINIEIVADMIINECIHLKKNVILSLYLLYHLSFVQEIGFYSYLLNICINDIFYLYNFFDVGISNELVTNINSYAYITQEYVNSLESVTVTLKNIDCPYTNSEFYIQNFIDEITI